MHVNPGCAILCTMKKAFRSIAIVGRQHTSGVAETVLHLLDCLKPLKVKVFLDKETALIVANKKIQTISKDQFGKYCDLLIVVGGDGSMLDVAPLAAKQRLPVLGINRGYLGFLTDIHPNKLDKISDILAGKYKEEQRFFLETKILNKDRCLASLMALNDIALSGGVISKLVEFSIKINDEEVCDYRADGFIVATPTGSTAYALSGGGPIVHPGLDAFVLVPMFSHNLSSRPMVVNADSFVDIIVPKSKLTSLSISSDGKERIMIPEGSMVRIKRASSQLRLIHPLSYNYFATLRNKLNWQK